MNIKIKISFWVEKEKSIVYVYQLEKNMTVIFGTGNFFMMMFL